MDHVGNSWFRMTPAVIPMRSAGMSNMTRSKSIRDLLAVGCFRLMLYKIDTNEPLAITAAEEIRKCQKCEEGQRQGNSVTEIGSKERPPSS
jgi:hypothetical protein